MPITNPVSAVSLVEALTEVSKTTPGTLCKLADGAIVRVPMVETIDITVLQKRRNALVEQLAGMIQKKEKPDNDCLECWNRQVEWERQPVEGQLAQVIKELAELEAV